LVFEKNANFFAENWQTIAKNCDHNIDPWSMRYKYSFEGLEMESLAQVFYVLWVSLGNLYFVAIWVWVPMYMYQTEFKSEKPIITLRTFTAFVQHSTRVARFFLVQHTKTGENIPNNHKITKWPQHIPNGPKIDQMVLK
jgi:hypothetical protein